MATCPNCGTSSKREPGALWLGEVLRAKPLGTWSLSGVTMKTVVVTETRLICRCGWSVAGTVDDSGEGFDADMRTQEFPTAESDDGSP